jgi:prevent-host-death family protein
MKVMTLRDAKARLSSVVEEANNERVLITKNGRPAAVVIGVEGHDTEDVMLISNPKFWAMIEESRRRDRTLTTEQVRERIARKEAAEAAPGVRRRRRATEKPSGA